MPEFAPHTAHTIANPPLATSVWSAALLLLTVGCEVSSSAGSATNGSELSFPKSLTHDFGVILGGETHEYSFRIPNHSTHTWNVLDVQSSCACTVVDLPRNRIAVGADLVVPVAYQAPSTVGNDTRSVVLRVDVRNGRTRRLTLRVQARVRKPMTIRPESLKLNLSAASPEISFEVQNWTAVHWSRIHVEPSVDWIGCQVSSIAVSAPQGVPGPREAWRVVLSSPGSTDRVRLGNDRTISLLVSGGPRNAALVSESVPVTLLGGARVYFSPRVLILRTDRHGRSVSGQAELMLPESFSQLEPSDASLQHDVGNDIQLQADWNVTEPGCWQLDVRASRQSHFPNRGLISVDFGRPELPQLDLPFYCVELGHE